MSKVIYVDFKNKSAKTDTEEKKHDYTSTNLEEENKALLERRKKAELDRRTLSNKIIATNLKSNTDEGRRW